MDQFRHQLVRVQVEHRGAHRHGNLERLTPAAVEVLALAVDAVVGPPVGMIVEGQERRHVVVGHEPHVTAVAPVATIRAAEGHGTLTAEADTARAAVTTASVQLALVDELGHFVQANAERGRPSRIVASVDDLPLDDSADERADRWASTMAGHETHLGVHDVVVAHADSVAAITLDHPSDRQAREDRDASVLATGATRASGAGDRAVPEQPDPFRTCFERDRDRILHDSSFRRLAGKTQVFVFPDDHQRTRMTHALEVTQVARSIAEALRLNVPLAEAIAIGHDCGHGPGGHASEDALSPYLDGGFDHAPWGADVTLQPLNLCRETLDGIRHHSWSLPAPQTPEGEVVSWADRIAYVCHDFEDAVAAGILRAEMLPPWSPRCAGTIDRASSARSSGR